MSSGRQRSPVEFEENKDENDADNKTRKTSDKENKDNESGSQQKRDRDVLDGRLRSLMAEVPHTKSSFPNVLDQYGKEEKEERNVKKDDVTGHKDKPHKSMKKKSKKKSKKTVVFYDSDEEKEKEKERDDEKYLQVLNDLEKLRNYYYNKYKRLLTEKVEKQRRKIRQQKEKSETEDKQMENSQKDASHKTKRRSEQHILSHDAEYMNAIPKSDVYMIIGLQDQMIKEGKLRSQADFDNFWMEMKKPSVFHTYFPGGLSSVSMTDTTTSTLTRAAVTAASMSAKETPPRLPSRALSNIEESRESRPTTQEETWAVTQQYKHVHTPDDPYHRSNLARQAAADLEKKCPKLEMPQLHCFNMELGKKPPDPEEVRLKTELKMREKNRRGFLKKLHKMHHLAMANGAAATRILDRHKYLTFIVEGPKLTDVLGDYYWEDSLEFGSRSPTELSISSSQPRSSFPRSTELPQITEQRRSSAPVYKQQVVKQQADKQLAIREKQSYSHQSARRTDSSMDSGKQLVPYTPPKPEPLSVNDILEKAKIMEAKCLSTNWINYAKAEKVCF
ncbi:uncharacterized protein LOC121370505 isoform X2 [Gigantopelta aegis]|uniref:uncharacterized protein LOC121370505 isoform X2 n=1 Tax=Gigantopelta aegis TaxID=1735272 RepID=UPI001B8899C4|nr:uncharacterized protein LOC121370505 isoform X2 [Gigantopelta aegis]